MAIPRTARVVSVLRETLAATAKVDRIGRQFGPVQPLEFKPQTTIDTWVPQSVLTPPAPLWQPRSPLRVVVLTHEQTQPVAGHGRKKATLRAEKSQKSESFQGLSTFTGDLLPISSLKVGKSRGVRGVIGDRLGAAVRRFVARHVQPDGAHAWGHVTRFCENVRAAVRTTFERRILSAFGQKSALNQRAWVSAK